MNLKTCNSFMEEFEHIKGTGAKFCRGKIYYVYILETIAKNNKKRFYTGYTNNLNRRLQEHKKGTGAKFCRGKKSIRLK